MSYIVSWTQHTYERPINLKDRWTYHEDFASAKAQYDTLLNQSLTWTASLTMVLESSDYPTHEGLADSVEKV